jgi:cholesterol transport system auxiliary component
MKIIDRFKTIQRKLIVVLIVSVGLAGCAPFSSPKVEAVKTYALEMDLEAISDTQTIPLVLFVNTTHAAPGFDSPGMIYVNQQYQRNFYAYNQWADAPSRMINALMVRTLSKNARFNAVVQAPSTIPADLRLDTELIRLQHEFTSYPSRVRLTMRAQLIDMAQRRILVTQEFDLTENAPSENPYGGVIAANKALSKALNQIIQFCIAGSVNLNADKKSNI